MTDYKIESWARGAASPSVIITDSGSNAKRFVDSMKAGEKWERIVLWNGGTKVMDWRRNDRG